IAGLLVASVQETSALLSGNTRNVQNGVSSSAVYSPSGLTATNQGSSVQLSWTAAQPNNNGNGNGYVVSGTSNGASPTCPSAAGASTVTADLGVVGSTPFASNIALTAVSASCAGTTYGYSSAVTTASNYSAGTNPALYVDIKATAGATTARSNQSHVGDASS